MLGAKWLGYGEYILSRENQTVGHECHLGLIRANGYVYVVIDGDVGSLRVEWIDDAWVVPI